MKKMLLVILLTFSSRLALAIVGGFEVQDDSVLNAASVMIETNEALCSGTAVSPHHILTAYHCIVDYYDLKSDKAKSKFLNAVKLSSGKNLTAMGSKVKKISVPPSILRSRAEDHGTLTVKDGVDLQTLLSNDLAILEVDGTLPIENRAELSNGKLAKGSLIQLAGYGSTSFLKNENYRVLRWTAKTLSSFEPTMTNKEGQLFPATSVCFVSHADLRGFSHGDSGGGAYRTDEDGKVRLTAVIANGFPKATSPDDALDDFGALVAIDSHREWLNSVLAEAPTVNPESN